MVRRALEQAAERAGVSEKLVYRWCAGHRLPHFRCGARGRRGRILIDPADLDAFMRTLKVDAGPPADGETFRHRRRPPAEPA